METVIVIGALVGVLAFFAWLAAESKKQGRTDERERQQRRTLDAAEDANRVRRDISRRDAINRLRNSKHNTDNVPPVPADPLLGRRSTDHDARTS